MMKVIFVDDERSAHINFYYDIKGRTEIESIEFFYEAEDALEYVRTHQIDCAFLDIHLNSEMNGLSLGEELKKLQTHLEIVFITASDEHAREAYRVGGCDYLGKPYTMDELNRTMDRLQKICMIHNIPREQKIETRNIRIKTFGNFDMLINNVSVNFKVAKAKELLAFLVEQRGGTVNAAQIFIALWENQEYSTATSTYVRRTARALKEELDNVGAGDILIFNRNSYSLDISRFTCDYYELLEGDREVATRYQDRYMDQYSWGELTVPWIERKVASLMNEDI